MNEDLKQAVEHTTTQGARYAAVLAFWSKTRHVSLTDTRTAYNQGTSIRALVGDHWGCASQSLSPSPALIPCCDLAIKQAKAANLLHSTPSPSPFRSSPPAPPPQTWTYPVKQNPWEMGTRIQRESLDYIVDRVRKLDPSLSVNAELWIWSCGSQLQSSEGHDISQQWTGCGVTFEVSTEEDGTPLRRRFGPHLVLGGWEALSDPNPFTVGWEIAQELLTLFAAPRALTSSPRDIILGPLAMATLLHEVIGHGLEADHIRQGRGLAPPESWQNAEVGSAWLNVEADATTPGGLGTWGFDDEGTAAQRWPLIKDGRIVSLLSNREEAAALGLPTSSGCARAQNPLGAPSVRMPNIHLSPGTTPLNTMLRSAHGGLYIDGVRRCEVDHLRGEVRLYAELAREIDGEYLTHGWAAPVVSLPLAGLWSRCEALADAAHTQMISLPTCSKGGGVWPWAGTSHRVVPGLFRQVLVWPG